MKASGGFRCNGQHVRWHADRDESSGRFYGFVRALVLGGESFFQKHLPRREYWRRNHPCTSTAWRYVRPGDAWWNPPLQSGAFVACSEIINLDTKWTGAKTFFAREGPIMYALREQAHWSLPVMVLSTNVISRQAKNINWTPVICGIRWWDGFEVQKVGGLKSTFFSGEGLVIQLAGPGRVLIQTRSEELS
jgi:hypothetical protein